MYGGASAPDDCGGEAGLRLEDLPRMLYLCVSVVVAGLVVCNSV